ncbi:MAG: nucleoside kinase [Bacilli bacterium]|nr:nucleoside kinase [Bacilli bacterium]MBN2876673.1 nucleoside kinase [Bacilli bacterium]
MKITVGKDVYHFDSYVRLEDLSKNYEGVFYAALVNNRLRELTYRVSYDATVEFLDYSFYDSTRIYATSMRYLVCMAFRRVYPDMQIKFSNSIAMGIYGRGIKRDISKDMLREVVKEMIRIIENDYPITRRQLSIKEAVYYYQKMGFKDKVSTLKYRTERVNVYECYGYRNYMYGYMVPSTRYLKEFEMHHLENGFLIQYPRREEKGEIPEFADSPKFFDILQEAESFAADHNADMIYKINELVENGGAEEFVYQCEERHNNQLQRLAEDIISRKNIRLIAIAGPSSSGKTTFSKRLGITLNDLGAHPISISIDNYYLHPDKAPLDEFGKPDLEHIESLDIELFNQNILDLINGKEVRLPVFDFTSKERIFQDPIQIANDTPIIIEGIHALNDQLSEMIPKEKKYKIYISPFAQINIDNNTPINLTDLRLLRRIVRDLQFRNTSAERTLAMWPSVRRGEYKWIYPHLENSDFIFNSELTYEFSVLKRYAKNALEQIQSESEYFVTANRLLKFIKYFDEIDSDYVPHNSLLREFIGGSIFEH